MTWYLTILAIIAVIIFVLNRWIRSLTLAGLDHKHVVVTGCDSGFGKELVVRLDAMGFYVHAGCLTDAGLESLRQLYSPRMETFHLDVTDPASIKAAHANVTGHLPMGLWALVNNAGVSGLEAPIEMCTVNDFDIAMKVNVYGHIAMTKTFLPLIRRAKGRVVNMTSICGRLAAINAPYCVSKFAFEGFSDCLRRELSPFGVKVSIIEPGIFKTEIFNSAAVMDRTASAYERSNEEVQTTYGGHLVSKMNKLCVNMANGASEDIYLVVDAYVHAITARFPASRYVVGNDAKFVFIPATFLPDWLTDSALGIVRNIRK